MVAAGLLAFYVFGFGTLALGAPTFDAFHVHDARAAAPAGYKAAGAADPGEVLNLRIALTQNNPDAIVDALYQVSDPSSEKYGQHLSKSEVSLNAAACCP